MVAFGAKIIIIRNVLSMLAVTLLKIFCILVFPLILIIFSLSGLKKIANSEKIVSFQIANRKSDYLVVSIYFLYSIFALLNKSTFGLIFGFILLLAAIMFPINKYIRSKKSGIYRNGVIIPSNQYIWKDIEGYIQIDNGIRIIHKDTGAFDIAVSEDLKNKIIIALKDIGINEIANDN